MKLSIPFTMDNGILDRLNPLHLEYIEEVYMPLPQSILGSCRPRGYKDADEYESNFESYIKKAKELGLKISLVANKEFIDLNSARPTSMKIISMAGKLNELYGIDKIVISNFYLLRQCGQLLSDMGICVELSVVTGVDSVGSFEQAISMFPYISSVCLADSFIHDVEAIKYIKEKYNHIEIKLMPNHGCMVDCVGCHQHHHYSTLVSKKVENEMDEHYNREMSVLISSTSVCACPQYSGIRTIGDLSFIRPEDIHLYEECVDLFKISGRLQTFDKIINTIEAYINKSYDGDICDLIDAADPLKRMSVIGTTLPEEFGKVRSKCNHKCFKCGYCKSI